MKKIILLITTLLTLLFAKAQPYQFQWAKKIGGPAVEQGNAMVMDPSGNIYIAGSFKGTVDFDPGAGIFNLTSNGFDDIFILKLNADGDFNWAKRIGGSSLEVVNSIVLDVTGNIYATGMFDGTLDFDPSASGTYNLISKGSSDVFIVKLDPTGNFIWAKNVGSKLAEFAWSISIDKNQNIYTTGEFQDTMDCNPGPGIFNLISVGSTDIFMSKLDSSGNFIWAKRIGWMGDDHVSNIMPDSSGNVYLSGLISGTIDVDPGPGIFNLTATTSYAIFILKLDASGNFAWAKLISKLNIDECLSMAMDAIGNLYITGYNSTGVADLFVSKIDPSGKFVWTKYWNGPLSDYGYCIRLDKTGNVYITGRFEGPTDFDPGAGTFNLMAAGGEDIFILKLDTSGTFVWATRIGGTGNDIGVSLVLDQVGNIYTSGTFNGIVDFDPDPSNTSTLTSTGANSDMFIQKMHPIGVGMNEISATQNKTNIYPNPSEGIFNVEISNLSADTRIEIYNCLGRLVYTKSTPLKLNTIDLSNQAEGIYYLKVFDGKNEVENLKIAKLR